MGTGPAGTSGAEEPSGRADPTAGARNPLLRLGELAVTVAGARGGRRVVDGVSLELARGEALALVGASGAGKSMTAMAVLGLTGPGTRIEGSIELAGEELVGAPPDVLRRVRGARIAAVFQDPATALDPVQRVERQVAEQLEAHGRVPPEGSRARVLELLERVRLPRAEEVARSYPFELSGGMRQRVTIAMAISCDPEVLIADEPTAALDAVVQAEVLGLLDELRRERGLAVLLATHDLRAVARTADRIAVMSDGRIAEQGTARELLERPRREQTRLLLTPPSGHRRSDRRSPGAPLLEVAGLEVRFRRRGPVGRSVAVGQEQLRAVDGVSLSVRGGETLALVGASGSGKTTVARAVLRLVEPAAGSIALAGRELLGLGRRRLRPIRRELQAVFQDPAASLNPRRRVGDSVAAPLREHGVDRRRAAARVAELLERVDLPSEYARRYPNELSGGERQRVGIARALALEPSLVVLDEPVSSLDAPVRGQVMDLLQRLQSELGIAYLLISHDLDVVTEAAHRVAVMDAGRLVESGPPRELLEQPTHPSTRALVEAARV